MILGGELFLLKESRFGRRKSNHVFFGNENHGDVPSENLSLGEGSRAARTAPECPGAHQEKLATTRRREAKAGPRTEGKAEERVFQHRSIKVHQIVLFFKIGNVFPCRALRREG